MNFIKKFINISYNLINIKELPKINGKKFNNDCIGFVRFVYCKTGVDIGKLFQISVSGGGDSLYYGLLKRKLIYTNYPPIPGSFIFFDNTYDSNKNGKLDDKLTHVGIVVKVDHYNTVHFIHYSGNVVKEGRINLVYPKTYAFRKKDGTLIIINSFLSRENNFKTISKIQKLSSSLFNSFGYIKVKYNN